jgi:hypothetical protein
MNALLTYGITAAIAALGLVQIYGGVALWMGLQSRALAAVLLVSGLLDLAAEGWLRVETYGLTWRDQHTVLSSIIAIWAVAYLCGAYSLWVGDSARLVSSVIIIAGVTIIVGECVFWLAMRGLAHM